MNLANETELAAKGIENLLNRLKSEIIIERIGVDKGGRWILKK